MSSSGGVESTANITDIHEPLHFDITEEHDNTYRCHMLLMHAHLQMVLQPRCITPEDHGWSLGATAWAAAVVYAPPARLDDRHLLARRHTFGIWSLRWASDGTEVIAGTGDHSLYVYSMERQQVRQRSWAVLCCLSMSSAHEPGAPGSTPGRPQAHAARQAWDAKHSPAIHAAGVPVCGAGRSPQLCMACPSRSCACCAQTTLRIAGHDDDVNAVAFLDAGSHLIATGSDDSLIKARPALPLPVEPWCGPCAVDIGTGYRWCRL